LKFRLLALLCVLTLVAAACGSRLSGEELRTGAGGGGGTATGSGTGSSSGGSTPGTGGTGGTSDASGATVGTLKAPCGKKGAGGSSASSAPAGQAPAGQVPGVTADKIRIGVISDKKNDITPVPTIGIEESVKGFVNYCNSLGGINGRTLVLSTYDSGIVKTDDVTKAACGDNLFALVGSGSVQDQQGVDTRVGCGLPEVGAYSATSQRASSKDFFQPVPATYADQFNVGACKYIAKTFPKAVKKAAIVYVDVAASKDRALATVEACEKNAGFKFVVKKGLAFGEKNFGPVVDEMKSQGVEYFTIVSVVPDTLALLAAMQQQDLKPQVVDLGQQYYDDAMLKSQASDGAYVLTNTTPFAEAGETPALKVYEKWSGEAGGQPTSLGVQAFSAGLMFAQAMSTLGDNVTREGLVNAVKNIKEWDGGGLQMKTDPGDGTLNSCFLYLKISSGKFVREFPKKGFACDPKNVVPITPASDS